MSDRRAGEPGPREHVWTPAEREAARVIGALARRREYFAAAIEQAIADGFLAPEYAETG